ncbi:LysM domain containing protein, putative [Angomonas deanei]|uniref:LysM domain containing protein, putative n=1 Tax=Angomonas deanei TaxID=59799 RepID=A0A7G2CFX9_9TRYP|nr:LysM domain containing protein, putative [Angomonas deanei]
MAGHQTPPSSLETLMDRGVSERLHHTRVLSPLEEQMDVGRLEKPLACAGKIAVDASEFPFRWNTEDWYEYEVSKVRNKRFVFENTEEGGVNGSEVTYKLVLEGFWDHHVLKLAEDVCMFIKDIGRHAVEEKLKNVRELLAALENGGSVDPEIRKAFNAPVKGPFSSKDMYDDEEVANFIRGDLRRLEEQCVSIINRCNVPVPGSTNLYDPNVSWPHVERLEPWVRLAEFWTSSSDTSFTELEMSTAHYEFRKHFRVVVVKLPFQSTEFEQRLYSIRHWLHRQTSCEFHTVYRRNVVHDASVFPTEHDPSLSPTHEHHRLFSFALDWQSAPVNYLSTEIVQPADTWESLASRVGCTVESLRHLNAQDAELKPGEHVRVPPNATNRRTSFGAVARTLPVRGDKPVKTWEDAASIIGCSVEDLQQANSFIASSYDPAKGFDPSVEELVVPHTEWESSVSDEFAKEENLFAGDTFESVAVRLGCTVADLKNANPKVSDIKSTSVLAVPASARFKRRIVHPQLRPQAATDALMARTMEEEQSFGIGELPSSPLNAEKFPHEYHTASSRYPTTPMQTSGTENWIAYTSRYLDKEFLLKDEPQPVYNTNRLWPFQQIPGKVDQTPFEEDQTWLLNPIPVQQLEQHHPEKDLQDLPFVNHEQFPRSIDWTAP